MMVSTETDNGDLILSDLEDEEIFSLHLLESDSPFINVSKGHITLTATNMQATYRIVGWYPNQMHHAVRAVLVSKVVY